MNEDDLMDRPTIKLAADDRMLWAIGSVILLACVLANCSGCVDGGTTGDNTPKPVVGKKTLEQVAFDAFQRRDVVRAEKLRALKGTKYDGNRMAAIAKAGADASQETWEPVAKQLAAVLDKVDQSNQAAFDNVLETLAKAAEKAGGK